MWVFNCCTCSDDKVGDMVSICTFPKGFNDLIKQLDFQAPLCIIIHLEIHSWNPQSSFKQKPNIVDEFLEIS